MNSESLSKIFAPIMNPCSTENKVTSEAIQITQKLIDNPDWIPKKQHPPLVKSYAVTFNSTELVSLQIIKPYLLLTEEIQWEHSGSILIGNNKKQMKGILFVSNYRILYQYSTTFHNNSSEIPFFEIPLTGILSIEKLSKDSQELIILSKNLMNFHLKFPSSEDCHRVFDYIRQFSPPQPLNQLFAFSYGLFYEEEGNTPVKSVLGARHTFLNPEVEYSRQGVNIPSEWRKYACKQSISYPRQILIPSSLKYEENEIFPKQYNNFRFPTLVYYHSNTSACILISSGVKKQVTLATMASAPNLTKNSVNNRISATNRISNARIPSDINDTSNKSLDKIGSIHSNTFGSGNLNNDDSELMKAIKDIQPSENIEIVTCLRPTDLAKLTFAPKNRKLLTFTDVEEIYGKLRKLIFDRSLPNNLSSSSSFSFDILKQSMNEWTSSLAEVILSSATTAVEIIRGKSFLLEDDEWNNLGTVGRVMIIIDPYYRTIRGFQKLIEHVWIRFGYPFADSIGIDSYHQTVSNSGATGSSGLLSDSKIGIHIGVFIHFIDSVFQIFQQFPSCFEFNEYFLISLLNSLFNGCYGTFLSNNEKQAFSKLPITVSAWNFLNENNINFINPLYTSKDISPLMPDTSIKKIIFWEGYFFQWISQQGIAKLLIHIQSLQINNNNQKDQKDQKKSDQKDQNNEDLSSGGSLGGGGGSSSPLSLLDISNYEISFLPDHIISNSIIQFICDINLSNNCFSSFPISLLLIKSLKSINLSQNHIVCIPQDIIGSLQNLEYLEMLDLRGNPIAYIDQSICVLKTLKILKLSGNGDKQDLKGILQMTFLRQLYLEKFGLENIPESLMEMKNLNLLSLAENKLTSIQISLCKLKTLNLSFNLLCNKNQIEIKCKKLQFLDLSSNQLTQIPKSVIKLNRITKLKLQNNKLERLTPEIIKLNKLQTLDILNNQIKIIPANICMLKKLESVRHTGNPIEFPPTHIVGKGTDVLLKFLEDRMNRSVPIRRVRLLLVGQENVGKSSISHYLKTNLPNKVNISTDGIQIDDWEIKINTGNVVQPVEIKIWDFAGQDVYYSTHQLFLGGQSIYIVVWNIISDERETRIRFWLESIKARTSGMDTSVILVATHIDHELCTPEYINDALGIIEKKYCSKFPFIKNIIGVSCSNGEGFTQLRGIIKQVISEQKYIGKFIPSKYLYFEDELLYKSKEILPPILSFEKFKKIAFLFDINNESEILESIDLFHKWGSVIHHNDIQLKDMVILDPAWLVQVMATILTTKHRYIKDGLLKHSDLIHIWHESEYPRKFHPSLLQLLQKFEVTYNLNDFLISYNKKQQQQQQQDQQQQQYWENSTSLVPSILPEMANENAKKLFPEFEKNINQYSREYKFNFIPAGFINHLLIRVIHQTLDYHYWRYGIAGFFRDDPSTKILLELLPQYCILKVLVRGNLPVKLFLRIIDIIDAFIESWFHLDVSISVPCIHCFYDHIQPIYRFTYEKCKDAIVHGESYLPCPFGSGSSVRLDVLVPDLSMAEVTKIEYSDIKIDKEIGKGGFATVYKAFYNNKTVALKQIDLSEGENNIEDAYSDFMRESWIMNGIQHPNIIAFIGLCSNPLCIVTDFASKGNLFDFLHSNDNKIQKQAKKFPLKCKIAFDIAKGMHFLHDRIPSIIHSDLKSPNILLFSFNPLDSVVAVVADFGLSKTWVPVLQGRQVDNPVWLAPEILCGKGYSESADVYAFGVILYEIFTLKEFFGEFTFMSALEDALMAGKRPPIPDTIDIQFKNLIELCWHQEPIKRPSFDEILKILRDLITKFITSDKINIKENDIIDSNLDENQQFEKYLSNQYLLHSFSMNLSNPITNIISVNNDDDIWCIEKSNLLILNSYDSYSTEKQIPLMNSLDFLEYVYYPSSTLSPSQNHDNQQQQQQQQQESEKKQISSPALSKKSNNSSGNNNIVIHIDNNYNNNHLSTSSGIVWTIDSNQTIRLWDSFSIRLLQTQKLNSTFGEILNLCCVNNEEMWLSTSSGVILIYNAFSLQPVVSHLNGSNLSPSPRISTSLRNILDKISHPKQGIELQNFSRNAITIYNCFKGNQLRQWIQKNFTSNENSQNNTDQQQQTTADQEKIISELLSKSFIIPAFKQKTKQSSSNKKHSRRKTKLRDDAYYVISSDISVGIELSIFQGSPIGFCLKMNNFENSKIYCFAYDNFDNLVWMGTDHGIVGFDLIRCGVFASIYCENIVHQIIIVDDNIWISFKNFNHLRIYNKFSLTLVRQIDAHQNPVTSLCYCDSVVWSASENGSLKLWSSSHYNLLETFSDFHTSEVLLLKKTNSSQSHILSSAKDGSVGIWKYCKNTQWEFSTDDIEQVCIFFLKLNLYLAFQI